MSHCTVHVRILFGGWGRVFQISLTRAGPCIRSKGNLMFNLTFYLVWEPATWYCISIVWLTAVLTDHCGLRYQPIEVQYCIEGIYCRVTSFQLIQAQYFHRKEVVFMSCIIKSLIWNWPLRGLADFKLTSDAKIQPAFAGREGSWLFLPWSCIGHTLHPICMP